MDSIRKGDKEMLRRSLQETYRGEGGMLPEKAFRNQTGLTPTEYREKLGRKK